MLRFGNPWSTVGHDCGDPASLRPAATPDRTAIAAMPDRVFDEIGEELGQKLPISVHCAGIRNRQRQALPGVLRRRAERIDHDVEHLRKIDRHEPRAPRPRFDVGDAQQPVEGFSNRVHLRNRRPHCRLARPLRRKGGRFKCLAEPGQRRFEIVRDVGRYLLNSIEEQFDTSKRSVDGGADAIKSSPPPTIGRRQLRLPSENAFSAASAPASRFVARPARKTAPPPPTNRTVAIPQRNAEIKMPVISSPRYSPSPTTI